MNGAAGGGRLGADGSAGGRRDGDVSLSWRLAATSLVDASGSRRGSHTGKGPRSRALLCRSTHASRATASGDKG